MTAATRTLLVLRHADAEQAGGRDRERPLSAVGRAQAERVGATLRDRLPHPELALCSIALRTRQTLDGLGLDLDAAAVDLSEDVYDAGSDTLLALVRGLPDDVRCALLVGHAPGVPQLVYDLSGPGSDPAALAAIDGRFGTATLARLEFDGAWGDLDQARLVEVTSG